ncbi:unnamed protein product [Chrysoparadoxa australica]
MSEARLQQGIEEKEKRKGGRRYNKLLREGAGLEKQDDLWDLRLEVAKLEDEVEELNASSMASEIMVGNLKFEREGSVRAPADKSRDLLLYIPGVDGLKIEGENQFDELSKHFDLWCVTFKGDDRTQFPQLLASVVEFMRLAGVSEDQKCVISGTSFGAMLAMGVAQIRPELVKGVAAVNPATSYERSVWPVVGNLVGLSPSTESFTVAAAAALVASLPDTAKIQRAMEDIFSLPLGERPMASVDMFLGYGSMMQQLLGEISPESLRFRLKNWLKAGAARVNSRLADMETPVLLIVGEEDRMLPSTEEAARLKAEVKNLEVISLEGIGHSALYDLKAVNLSQMIQDSFLYKGAPAQQDKAEPPNGAGKPKKEDPVKDFKLDTEGEEYKGAVNFMKTLEKLTSPIYLSTTEEGKIIRGLGGVPEHVVGETEPVLFVGNHQLFGGDLPLVVGGLLNQKNILARGLAHPMIFVSEKDPDWDVVLPREAPTAGNAGNDPTVQDLLGELGFNSLAQVASNLPGGQQRVSRVLGSIDGVIQLAQGVQGAGKDAQEKAEKEKNPATGDTQDGQRGLFGTFKALGAVEVNPRNFYRLMQTGQAALLFPGGVREAMHNKGEEYALFWPEQSEFVRVAAQFNATIVPFSAVGTADSVDLVFDGAQMKEFSFGAQSVTAASILPNARPNVEEQIIPPLPIPKLPARHFFLFGKPISTAGVDKKDLAACEAIYKEVKGEVQGGIGQQHLHSPAPLFPLLTHSLSGHPLIPLDYLLESRELDPYMDTTKRLVRPTPHTTQIHAILRPTPSINPSHVHPSQLYEAINGQAAPSFSLQLAAKKREAVRRAEGKDKALEEVGSSR